ncbi:hypothetical protein JTB14_023465 [Gonioctena quinquepunctata]|nr:hypothetical protein JTB14_023465 [Gonioctena quinquepunctata]
MKPDEYRRELGEFEKRLRELKRDIESYERFKNTVRLLNNLSIREKAFEHKTPPSRLWCNWNHKGKSRSKFLYTDGQEALFQAGQRPHGICSGKKQWRPACTLDG